MSIVGGVEEGFKAGRINYSPSRHDDTGPNKISSWRFTTSKHASSYLDYLFVILKSQDYPRDLDIVSLSSPPHFPRQPPPAGLWGRTASSVPENQSPDHSSNIFTKQTTTLQLLTPSQCASSRNVVPETFSSAVTFITDSSSPSPSKHHATTLASLFFSTHHSPQNSSSTNVYLLITAPSRVYTPW